MGRRLARGLTRSCAVVGVGLLLAACGGKKGNALGGSSDGSAGGGSAGSGSASGPVAVDSPPHSAPVSAKRLAPIIHELGLTNVVPTAIVIEVATPIVDPGLVGSTSSESKIVITPDLPGSLTYTGVSELTFRPSVALAFGTSYKVELTSLETRDGIIKLTATDKWSYEFKTQGFQFMRWAPTDLALATHKVTMEIAFSGPVLPNIARAAMTFTVDGKPIVNVEALPTRTPSTMAVQLSDPRIKLGAKLALVLAKGMKTMGNATAADGASVDYVIGNESAVAIKTAAVVEGANGFYVEVVMRRQGRAVGLSLVLPSMKTATTTCRSAASSPTRRSRRSTSIRRSRRRTSPAAAPAFACSATSSARHVLDQDRWRRDDCRRRRRARAVRAFVLGVGAQARAVVRRQRAATCRARRGATSASSRPQHRGRGEPRRAPGAAGELDPTGWATTAPTPSTSAPATSSSRRRSPCAAIPISRRRRGSMSRRCCRRRPRACSSCA